MNWQILNGDCRDVLGTLPAASVHTCVTSPPYFGLRDYGHDGQIGLEPTPDEFVAALVGVFREVRRVLRDDGTVWLNLGDSYAGSWGAQSRTMGAVSDKSTLRGNGHVGGGPKVQGLSGTQIAAHPKGQTRTGSIPPDSDYKPKDLLGIPWLVAFALRADGWYLRSEIIWHKPNPMPESVTDRPTKAHEQVFLLSKSPRYFYDADAVREEPAASTLADLRMPRSRPYEGDPRGGNQSHAAASAGHPVPTPEAGRNKRSVWTVATQPYAGAHFATFPPKLIEPCILAGCPERCCSECGAPWERVTDGATYYEGDDGTRTRKTNMVGNGHGGGGRGPKNNLGQRIAQTLGFEPSCTHNADDASPGTVLDPFAGAGTTGMVALRHGRSFVGVELNAEYAAMARDRIATDLRLGFRAPKKVAAIEGHGSLFDGLEDAA